MTKSEQYKRELKHRRIDPVAIVEIDEDPKSFQGYSVRKVGDATFPIILERNEVILDFGSHYTGYLHMDLNSGCEEHIPDSPTNLTFNFAEMPLELMETIEDNPYSLSIGWLQNDFKTVAFMPYSGSLERRYSFRYLRIKRVDSVRFPIALESIWLDSVSAVELESVAPLNSADPLLNEIDRISLKTLAECEQDVFEDGPKRDRRLWIGDLRLQALVDYDTFRNLDLIRRCLYLFAEHTNKAGLVAPCVFPDTKPYVDQWILTDYCLCFGLCLQDYLENTGDKTLPDELYDVAEFQVRYTANAFDRATGRIESPFFIDHGGCDKSVASLGYFAYTLRRMILLAEALERPSEWMVSLLAEVDAALLNKKRDAETGLFVADNGELSWHSQVWAALSGALSAEEARRLLEDTVKADPAVRMTSPFMTHYYLEALCSCGLEDKAMEEIRSYWGGILKAGFDCCPECFDERNERLSPYTHPVLNSACHAWSCTPTYWIRRFAK